MSVVAIQETAKNPLRVNVERDYAELDSSVHGIVDSVTLHGMGYFGNGQSSQFRVDNIEDNTLEDARAILETNIGKQLPRFYIDESEEQKSMGLTPVIEERHARFVQEGEPFQGWNGNASVMLRVQDNIEQSDSELESKSVISDTELNKRQLAALYIMGLLSQAPGQAGLVFSLKSGDLRPAALGISMSAGLSVVSMVITKNVGVGLAKDSE